LWQVSASGGTPKTLTELKTERGHRWPDILPDGKAVIFTAATGGEWDNAQIVLLDLATGQRLTLIDGGTYGHYVSPGHLVYAKGGALMAVPFDVAARKVTGTPVRMIEGIVEAPRTGSAQFSISRNGTLVYLAGMPEGSGRKLVWVNRDGSTEPIPAPPRPYITPRISPDGKRLAVASEEITFSISLYDIAAKTMSPWTTGASSTFPIWTPDGSRLAFRSAAAGPWNVFWKAVDAQEQPEQLIKSDHINEPTSWSPDGRTLAFTDLDPVTGRDVWILEIEGRRQRPMVRTMAEDAGGTFSPDGRWMAYASEESGPSEIYIIPTSGSGNKQKVSTAGGTEPVWPRSGNELFYRQGNQLMAVEVQTQPVLRVGQPFRLFEGNYITGLLGRPNYDVTADRRRFVMIQAPDPQETVLQPNITFNWLDELERRVQ
jgi:Tol biopolymer transport system component